MPALRPLSRGASWGKLTSCRGAIVGSQCSVHFLLGPLCQSHSFPHHLTLLHSLWWYGSNDFVCRLNYMVRHQLLRNSNSSNFSSKLGPRKAVSENNRVSHARNDSQRPCDSMPFCGNCRKMPATLHFALLCTATKLKLSRKQTFWLAKSNSAGPVDQKDQKRPKPNRTGPFIIRT